MEKSNVGNENDFFCCKDCMKKRSLLILISFFFLSGCSQSNSIENRVLHPYEIVRGTSALSYYDTEDDIHIDGFNVLENNLQNFQDKNNNIIVNDDGMIRCITITDAAVKTYRSISVGDSVDKIEDTFEYESEFNNYYSVLFNGSTEENPADQDREDNWILINYFTDGSHITAIKICDVKYGREFQ